MKRSLCLLTLVVTLSVLLLGSVLSPPTAAAAVRIGPDVNAMSSSAAGCGDTAPATCSNTPSALSVSPVAGVVVRWRVRVSNAADTATFRILRGTSAGAFAGAGASQPSPAFKGIGEFATRLPIQAGDRIAVDLPPVKGPCAENCVKTISGGSADIWQPRLAEGGGSGRAPDFTVGATMLINADVEPDADSDGFGDETQDRCLAAQGSQEGCPPPPPPPIPQASPLQLKLGGPVRQDVLKRGAAVIFVTSSALSTVIATATIEVRAGGKGRIGTLIPASSNLAPGAVTRLKLKLPKKARRRARKAVGNGRQLKATATVFVEGSGSSATGKRTIHFKKRRTANSARD